MESGLTEGFVVLKKLSAVLAVMMAALLFAAVPASADVVTASGGFSWWNVETLGGGFSWWNVETFGGGFSWWNVETLSGGFSWWNIESLSGVLRLW